MIKNVDKQQSLNILITSAGRRTYLVKYFKKELGHVGKIHVANSSEISPALQYADEYVVTPLIYDDNYIPFLLDYCIKNKINAIISLFDVDLLILAKNKQKFDNIGVKLIVSDEKIIDISNDKWKTYNYLSENGFKTPKTYISLEDAKKALNNGSIDYPLIVKPRWGMGSIGIFEAENNSELDIFYNKVLEKIKNSYLKYESNTDIKNSVLIQEKIKGQEYGLDIINDLNGNYINTIVKQKYAMRSGETDCAMTVDNPEIKNTGKILSEKLKHIANLDVDVFLKDDEIYVLEMNARLGGGYPFSHMAGVNLPKAIIHWLLNEKVDNTILQENTNILSHKTISIVSIYNNLSIKNVSLDSIFLNNYLKTIDNSYNPPLSHRTDLSSYAEKLGNFADFVVAKINEDVVGLIAYYSNDEKKEQAYITLVSVLDKYSGNGIASKMLNFVINNVRNKNIKKLFVKTEKYNHSAINLYNKFGFIVEQKDNNKLLFVKDMANE